MFTFCSYDHLDLPSIMAIHQQFPEVIYFVPLGTFVSATPRTRFSSILFRVCCSQIALDDTEWS